MQTKKMAGVAALVALGLSAGGAYTASNTVPNIVSGYGSNTITGADVQTLEFTYSNDMTTITNANLVFTASQTGRVVKASFNGDAPVTCTEDTGDVTGKTWDCTFSQSVEEADNFNVSVTEP